MVKSNEDIRFITLTGEKVRLRPVEKRDIKAALPWRNDPRIRDAQMGFRFPVDESMEAKWNDRASNGSTQTSIFFSIDDLEDDRHIGFIQLYDIDWISRTAQFGVTIGDVSRHRRGRGRDATRLILRYAFSSINLERIWLRVPGFNIGAQKIYKEVGFVQEGIMRNHYILDNTYHDVLIFGLLKSEFYDG